MIGWNFNALALRSTLLFCSPLVVGACDNKDAPAAEHGHSHADGEAHTHDAECSCSKGKGGGTIWCDSCNMGYIKGEKTDDKKKVDEALAAK